MKIVEICNLPSGTLVRGVLYEDPSHVYGLGDVLEVELPTGRTIDVSWDEDSPGNPFRIVVYREYFGDRLVDFCVRNVDDVVSAIHRLAEEHSHPYVATACSQTDMLSILQIAARPLLPLAAGVGSAFNAVPEKGTC
jgi:hypothetical protein